MKIPVCVQNRHVHLSEKDCKKLFNTTELVTKQNANHKGHVVYEETLTVQGPEGEFESVRVVGSCREKTQVELSATDAYALGIDVPVRLSGDLTRSGSCKLKGPKGELKATSAVIIPIRHLHCNPQHAKHFGLKHHQVVGLVHEPSDTKIDHVTVRVHPSYSLQLDLTSDEAAESWVHTGDTVSLIL